MNLFELEEGLRDALALYTPAMRAELLYTLTLPDFDRAGHIGGAVPPPGDARARRAPDRRRGGPYLRAVLVGMLREA
ncbi:MAG TPA: hypothetical protein VFR44_14925 [Actinomycetota bacterium]|nr:hypothetical protein [Actinomycetota bacterium]